MSDSHWFIGFLIVIAIVWFTGKAAVNNLPSQEGVKTAEQAPKTLPEQVKDVEKEAKRLEEEVKKAAEEANYSPLKGKLFIAGLSRGSGAAQEYVLIQTASNNSEPVTITGLIVKSGVSLLSHTLPRGWTLPYLNATGVGDTVTLPPGGRAYLISGRSPLGLSTGRMMNNASFQLNKCTGFFEQGLDFSPSLPMTCPAPISEPLPQPPNALSDACMDYLRGIGGCSLPTAYPQSLSGDGNCQAHVFNKIGYSQCVNLHKNEPDFFTGEWRIYLGRDTRLWRDKTEIVELYDATGKLIDSKNL